ncbi:unnamed protein product [Durusdinium trenchii]|uniref:Phospholipid-transporting ATPase n=1 Tax=Durusdinium trenchii TaxID=1381693 RepID=A0ABP0S797_9DINO
MMWSSTVVPFIGVLLWTAFKDLYEDRRRKKDDDAENLRMCWRYDTKGKRFEQVRWMDVRVGDILLNFADEAFAADVLLVRAAGGQAGDFFITCAKDGEVNLVRTETCERVGTYGDKGGAVYAVDVTMDSTYVVTANADGSLPDKFKSQSEGLVPNRIMIWQFDPVKRILSIDEQLPMKATKVSIFEEGTVIIWDAEDGRQLKLIQAHQMAITRSMNFTEDRMMMATCSKAGAPQNSAELRRATDVGVACSDGGESSGDVAVSGASGAFEALLWHMVFEEEIGSVKGHIGPLKLAVMTAQHLQAEGLQVELQAPKPVLTDMEGSVKLASASPKTEAKLTELQVSSPCKLSYELFVPRGCVLRNTLYVISIAAFCGPQTKTRLNAAEAVGKVSNMQVYLNRGVQGLVIALILWCIYCATSAEIQGVSVADGRNWFLRFLFYWIILYQIIPISLYVFFEIVKLVLGFQINRDPQMVDPRSKLGATARTADLVEEMGQVNFVFSDKTGTLTENEMVFAHCCVCHDADARDLGDFRQTAKLVEKAEEPPGVAEGKLILSSTQDPRHAEVLWFFVNLATNHSVQVEGEGTNKKFEGSSADEVAFVEAAKDVGVTFVSRTRIPGTSSTEVVLKGPGSKDFTFTILCEIPFSSDRKRMSVIVKHEGEYWCLCKGADNIMGPLCDRPLGGSLGASLTQYSKLGLRTLVIASKKMDDQEFVEDWLVRWKEATVSEDREAEMARVASEVEHSLKAAGVTAIEDKLQDGVPEAITSIKAAGIRFWVLTGDKTETAVEIAKACKLFSDSMTLAYLVNCSNESQALQLIEDAKTTLDGKPDGGLVLDGTFVQQILTSKDGRPMLYELAMASKSCVCCRLSPQQKRRLVELVKDMNRTGITLAIGDGANDVPMIQGAHVGIGIRGKEGNQAVQASDVAVSQFRFLVPLLFCHGRRAYRRVATFICYMFYKHTVLAIGDIFFAHQITFHAKIAYPEWLNSAYASVICGLPVVIVVSLDYDIPDKVALSRPDLYVEGPRRMRFNAPILIAWMLSALYHGGVAWLVPNLTAGTVDTEEDEFWYASCVSFILCVVFVNFRLWMVAESPFRKETVLILLFSFLSLAVTFA